MFEGEGKSVWRMSPATIKLCASLFSCPLPLQFVPLLNLGFVIHIYSSRLQMFFSLNCMIQWWNGFEQMLACECYSFLSWHILYTNSRFLCLVCLSLAREEFKLNNMGLISSSKKNNAGTKFDKAHIAPLQPRFPLHLQLLPVLPERLRVNICPLKGCLMKENDIRFNFERAGLNCSVTVTSETQRYVIWHLFLPIYKVELTIQSW